MSAVDYIHALDTVTEVRERLAAFFAGVDILLTPTLAQPPVPLGILGTGSTDLDGFIVAVRGFAPYTQTFNMSGQPAAAPSPWH